MTLEKNGTVRDAQLSHQRPRRLGIPNPKSVGGGEQMGKGKRKSSNSSGT